MPPALDFDIPDPVTSEIETTDNGESRRRLQTHRTREKLLRLQPITKKTPSKKKKAAAAIDEKVSAPTPASEKTPEADFDQPSVSPVIEKFSLAIGAARAYFRPGIRIGNPALRTTEPSTPESPQQEPDAPEAPAQLALDALAAAEPIDDAIKFGAPQEAEEIVPETATTEPEPESTTDLLTQGDLDHAFENQTAQPIQRKKRRKNFLTRRYQLMPTHFWPKSWTRHKRRLDAGKLENTTPPAANEATPAAQTKARDAKRRIQRLQVF